MRNGFAIAVVVVVVGCSSAGADPAEQNAASGEEDLVTSAHLMYEGTCAFLHHCSSYSRRLPAGEVEWGCTGAEVCSDEALWVAGPSHAWCGKHVKICRSAGCGTAVVKDVSDAPRGEG